jgi:ABC-type proline/glycine betaine transport system substrate-binding protein
MFKRSFFLTAAAAALCLGSAGESAMAAEREIVSYRLKDWTTAEFEDSGKAETHYKTLKKLGCEVKQEQHEDHIDVTYRCPKWREIAVKSHSDAHKWEDWLKDCGFETKHKH